MFRIGLCFTLALAACSNSEATQPAPETAFTQHLHGVDQQITAAESKASALPPDPLAVERLANLWLQRARLTGAIDDYVEADTIMTRAAASPLTPWLSRAVLSFTLHRLDDCEADLNALEAIPLRLGGSQLDISVLRGDIAYHRSDYAEALGHYEAAFNTRGTFGTAFRLALYHSNAGNDTEAKRFVAVARLRLPETDIRSQAWLTFQEGVMALEQNRLVTARSKFEEADREFSGWYLFEEHIAEVDVLEGHPERAEPVYRDIIQRTELPEYMDALAAILEARGDSAEGEALRQRAGRSYMAQLAKLPAAAAGHALDHYLEVGPPSRSLELALENHARRPNAEAKLQLALAYAKNGDAASLDVLQEVLGAPFRTRALIETCNDVMQLLSPAATHPVRLQCATLGLPNP